MFSFNEMMDEHEFNDTCSHIASVFRFPGGKHSNYVKDALVHIKRSTEEKGASVLRKYFKIASMKLIQIERADCIEVKYPVRYGQDPKVFIYCIVDTLHLGYAHCMKGGHFYRLNTRPMYQPTWHEKLMDMGSFVGREYLHPHIGPRLSDFDD